MDNRALLREKGGEGVPADPLRYVALYERVIEGGSERAMVNLARILSKGASGVDMNLIGAIGLYSRVILHGSNTRYIRLAKKKKSLLTATCIAI